MIQRYRDVQYFGSLSYIGVSALSAACIVTGLVQGVGRGLSAAAMAWFAMGVLLVLLIVALGRMVVTVDRETLKIAFGWLGLARARFKLDRVDRVRVCIVQPVASFLGWPRRCAVDGSTCYSTQGRRGVEILAAGRRFLVSSADPQKLKLAVLRCSKPADDRPEYLLKAIKMPRARRVVKHQNWGLLDPRKMRAISA